MKKLSFEEELISLIPFIKGLSLKYLKDMEEAEEHTSHILLKALEKKENYQDQGKLKAWVSTLVFNEFVNVYRKGKKYQFCDIEECGNVFGESAKHDPFYGDRLIEEAVEQAERILKEYSQTSINAATHLKVIRMRAKGLKFREISEELGVDAVTIRGYSGRVRRFAIQKRRKLSA